MSGGNLFQLKNKKKVNFRGGGDLQQNLKDKYFVDIPNLNNNILKIKYKSFGTPLPNFSPITISNNVKNVILQIIHNHVKDANIEYKKLSGEDKQIIIKLCSIIECDIIDDIVQAKDMLFQKYQVLSGEIKAGNDSIEVIKMLKNVMIELYENKYITKHQYLDVVNMLA